MEKIKPKERILKVAREEKLAVYSHRTLSWLSSRKFQARREWYDIFKVMKGKKPYNQEYSTW